MAEKTSPQNLRDATIFYLESLANSGVVDVPAPRRAMTAATPTPEPAMAAKKPIATPKRDVEIEDLSRIKTLGELSDHIGPCVRCKLCEKRTNVVFGIGDPKARLMFVGEGPGADEDLKGEPFVGRAGQLLTKMIEAMTLSREKVFIANVVKCRPPENRNPEPDEIASCMPFLKKQIALVNPEVIVCLGKFAAQTVLDTQIPITKLRGRFQTVDGRAVMPTLHPAYLLRNPPMKKFAWEDLQKVMEKLGMPVPKKD